MEVIMLAELPTAQAQPGTGRRLPVTREYITCRLRNVFVVLPATDLFSNVLFK